MNSSFPDEIVIREYLLGTLPEQDWDEIEQKLLSDEEFAEFVDSIEDEIIEEYLTVQNHFLCPPERQRKLLFARVLRSNVRKAEKAPAYVSRPLPPARISRVYWGATIGAAAVLLLLTAPLTIYTATLHSSLAAANAKSNNAESTLAQVSEQAAHLQKELALRGTHDSISLLTPVDRTAGQTPSFTFPTKTGSIEINIPLDGRISPPYHVDLQVAGNALWSQDNIQPTDSGILIFRTPYYGPGIYSLTLTSSHNTAGVSAEKYLFKTGEQTPDSSSKR
jgi:hypothetical protein